MNHPVDNKMKHLAEIVIGSAIYAVGISLFLDPNKLAPGGITGVAVILNRLIPIETGTLYLLLNIPLIILGIWKFGFRFIARTLIAVFLISFFTNLLNPIGGVTDDLLIAAAAGGILIAIGIGIIFRAGATTGGTDIVVKILRQRFRHLKTGLLFLMMDVVIVSISGLVFKDLNIVFYALASVLVTGKALDMVLYGRDEATMMYVISKESDVIGKRIMKELDVGVTYLDGQGGWTKTPQKVIFTVVQKRVGIEVEKIVKEEDPDAFLIVTSASEIFGEGYKELMGEAL